MSREEDFDKVEELFRLNRFSDNDVALVRWAGQLGLAHVKEGEAPTRHHIKYRLPASDMEAMAYQIIHNRVQSHRRS